MSRKITVFMYAGFSGTESCEAYIVPDDVSDDELNDFAWERGVEHAAMYGVYPRNDEDTEEDSDDWRSECSDSIEGHWKPYSPKHDGHLICGTAKEVYWNEY